MSGHEALRHDLRDDDAVDNTVDNTVVPDGVLVAKCNRCRQIVWLARVGPEARRSRRVRSIIVLEAQPLPRGGIAIHEGEADFVVGAGNYRLHRCPKLGRMRPGSD